ncbi:monovalent cation/H+ antiporter subunit D family protein [Georgenia sp. Z1344]|uniref:monovalent cation/H+ antiporter subunit D family protein n=1 Tax=Georgenia sp. Z1344 TaxID=3416706 RepID=UPI003CF24439
MNAAVLPLFVAVPLLVGGLLVVVGDRPRVQAVTSFAVLAASLAGGVALVAHFRDGGAIAHDVGMWETGIAIPFVADMFSALMLVVTGILTLTCTAFAHASGRAASRYFGPLVLVLTAGVNGILLTGDIFNMFVFIEVMVVPAYGLYVLARPASATLGQIAGARLFVTVNMLTSTLFVSGVGLVYGVAGTVNLAELQGAAAEDPFVAAAGAVCLFALSIKAAVVPVHGWLAKAYPGTSPAVTALFSGLNTKVAIYAIYRIYAVLFDGDSRYLWIGVVAFAATMVIGVLGAVGETTTRSILAFHMVSQIGYILLGVALFTLAGLTAGIFYLLHHMIVKASLFLSTGAIEVRYGTGRVGALSGIARREPVLAVAFFVAALSLAGIPPFSGFVAKLSLITASIGAGEIGAVVVMLAVSLVTLLSMLKIWSGMFWDRKAGSAASGAATQQDADAAPFAEEGDSVPPASAGARPATNDQAPRTTTNDAAATATVTAARTATDPTTDPTDDTATAAESPVPEDGGRRVGAALAAPAVALAAVTVALGLGGELLLGLSETAAQGLLDTSTYVEAVLGR